MLVSTPIRNIVSSKSILILKLGEAHLITGVLVPHFFKIIFALSGYVDSATSIFVVY